jgi:DNA-binding LacI/PurR family transcriptional regulator
VLIDQTDGLADREREVAAGLRGHLIDGLLLSPVALGAEDLLPLAAQTPVVLLGERISGGQLDHVAVDNVAAASAATEHLLSLGRRRIAAIGAQREPEAASGVADLRQRGFVEAALAAGVPVPAERMPFVHAYTRAEGARVMSDLLRSPDRPDAVFCFNDLLALGALRALAEAGVRVPEDVAVIGFDDIEDGQYATPSLSTVSPDKQALARVSVDLLAELIEGAEGTLHRDVTVPFTLVERESTVGTGRGSR